MLKLFYFCFRLKIANRATVSAIFAMSEDVEKKFTRSIIGATAEHRIDNEVVSSAVYLKELEKLGINVNAKNFLVFQVSHPASSNLLRTFVGTIF